MATMEEIILEMVEQDFVIKMPPKKKYKIHVLVRNVKKGKPRVVEPRSVMGDENKRRYNIFQK
jgi:hypothetical protein